MSGRGISVEGLAEPESDWSRGAATPDTEVELFATSRMLLALRVERFEDDRCRLADVGGMELEELYGYWSVNISDVEDVVEATDAV
jgi:hypothetical protein